jgi:hypothetical protein
MTIDIKTTSGTDTQPTNRLLKAEDLLQASGGVLLLPAVQAAREAQRVST